MEIQLANIKRLTDTFSAEQLVALLLGTLTGVAETMGNDGVEFVDEWIESTITEFTKLQGNEG